MYPDHDLKKNFNVDSTRSILVLELLQDLKKKMYESLNKLEKEVYSAIEKIKEILEQTNSNISKNVEFIESIEQRIYEQGYVTDGTSDLDLFLQGNVFGYDIILNNCFKMKMNFGKLTRFFPMLVSTRFDLGHFVGDFGGKSQVQTTEKYQSIEKDLNSYQQHLVKIKKNIVDVKEIYKPEFMIESLSHFISNIEYKDFRNQVKVFEITSDICASKVRCQCLSIFPNIFINANEIQLIELDPVHILSISNLFQLKKLKRFKIIKCLTLDHASYKRLGEKLKEQWHLKEFVFENCRCGEDGMRNVLHNIRCDEIQVLNLNGNVIGSAGALILRNSLQNCTILRELYLKNNDLGERGLACIQVPLSRLHFLEILDISENVLKLKGLSLLFESIKSLIFLSVLDISSNEIEEEEETNQSASEIFAKYLPLMHSLENLVVDMTISRKLTKEILQLKPKNCIVFRGNLTQRTILK